MVWVLLPLMAGPAFSDALDGWSRAPRIVAGVLLWAAWAAALVSVLAPRPLGLTVTRVVALVFAAVAVASAWAAPAPAVAAAVATTVLAALLAGRPAFGRASADGVAYGDESRFPLKVPPALAVGPAPVAVLVLGAGVACGPLLLASGHIVAGVIAVVVGFPLAAFLARALHGLSTRWVVLVPAGVTLVDSMTLADPLLFPRDRVAGVERVGLRAEPDALDVRLGASVGALALRLTDEAQILTAGRARRASERVSTRTLVFAPVEPDAFLAAVTKRMRPRSVT